MTITYATVYRELKHALDGSDPSSELIALEIANQAGEWLYDINDWRWKSRPPATLATVAGQTWIALPSDCGAIIGNPQGPPAAPYPLRLTTISDIARMRAISSPSSPTGFFGALVYSAADADSPILPRLEIWPTPDVSNSALAQIYYRAQWTPLTSDDSVVQVPRYCERLYLSAARALLGGLEDDAQEPVESRLMRVLEGPFYKAAMLRDQEEQTDYGPMAQGPAAGYDGVGFGAPSPWPVYVPPSF